jgi:hypothetical protein
LLDPPISRVVIQHTQERERVDRLTVDGRESPAVGTARGQQDPLDPVTGVKADFPGNTQECSDLGPVRRVHGCGTGLDRPAVPRGRVGKTGAGAAQRSSCESG